RRGFDLRARALELAGGIVRPDRAVELVGAAVGDDVEDAADGLAVLREIAAGDDAELLHELDREGRGEDAEGRIVHGDAVDDERVLRRGCAGDGHAEAVRGRAWGYPGERLERPRGGALAT